MYLRAHYIRQRGYLYASESSLQQVQRLIYPSDGILQQVHWLKYAPETMTAELFELYILIGK